MKEYRAQLDADRAERLSKGTNHANLRVKAGDMKSKVSHGTAGQIQVSILLCVMSLPKLYLVGCDFLA